MGIFSRKRERMRVLENYAMVDVVPKRPINSNTELETRLPDTTFGEGIVIRPRAIVYAGSTFGRGCFVGDGAIVRENVDVGDFTTIGAGVIIEQACFLSDQVKVMSGAYLSAGTKVGPGCFIGPRVCTTNDRYMGSREVADEVRARERCAPVFHKGCYIGANVTVLPGVEVFTGVKVAAGSVITKDLERPGLYIPVNGKLTWTRENINR